MNETLSNEELIEQLRLVPSDDDPEFATAVRRIGLASDPANIEARLQHLNRIATDRSMSEQVAFAAFMSALTNYRRRNKGAQVRALIAQCEPRFGHRSLFQFHRAAAGLTRNATEIFAAIAIARAEVDKRPADAGWLNAYAELVARGLEEGLIQDHDGNLLRAARHAADKSIGVAPNYAKYRATFARLLLLQGQYESARSAIDMAIELEDDLIADYHVRLSNYLAIRQRITQHEQNRSLANEIDEARSAIQIDLERTRAELEQSRTKSVEVLAFFSAVIALVLTGSQEAKSLSTSGAQSVLLLLCAVLLISFAGLGAILYSRVPRGRTITLLAIGVPLLLLSLHLRSSDTANEAAHNPVAGAPAASAPASAPARP